MKRYLIGTIFGFVLATAVGANAQEVNKVIDSVVQGVFPVTVEGNSVGDAIVVNDKTYLPVREFGEAVGYTVTFTEDREVVLTKNLESTTPEVTPTPQPTSSTKPTKEDIDGKISYYKQLIWTANANITMLKENIVLNPDKADELNKSIGEQQAKIADYESQIAALEVQK